MDCGTWLQHQLIGTTHLCVVTPELQVEAAQAPPPHLLFFFVSQLIVSIQELKRKNHVRGTEHQDASRFSEGRANLRPEEPAEDEEVAAEDEDAADAQLERRIVGRQQRRQQAGHTEGRHGNYTQRERLWTTR